MLTKTPPLSTSCARATRSDIPSVSGLRYCECSTKRWQHFTNSSLQQGNTSPPPTHTALAHQTPALLLSLKTLSPERATSYRAMRWFGSRNNGHKTSAGQVDDTDQCNRPRTTLPRTQSRSVLAPSPTPFPPQLAQSPSTAAGVRRCAHTQRARVTWHFSEHNPPVRSLAAPSVLVCSRVYLRLCP